MDELIEFKIKLKTVADLERNADNFYRSIRSVVALATPKLKEMPDVKPFISSLRIRK